MERFKAYRLTETADKKIRAEFATFVARETEKWTRVVREAGIKPE